MPACPLGLCLLICKVGISRASHTLGPQRGRNVSKTQCFPDKSSLPALASGLKPLLLPGVSHPGPPAPQPGLRTTPGPALLCLSPTVVLGSGWRRYCWLLTCGGQGMSCSGHTGDGGPSVDLASDRFQVSRASLKKVLGGVAPPPAGLSLGI